MRQILLPLLLPISIFSQPQSFQLGPGCAYDGEQSGNNVYLFESSGEANRIVGEVVDALGLQQNFVVKSSSVQNALATTENGQRYILYSTDFLEKFKADAKTRWAAYSVLAHEIGHHLNAHDFSEKDPRTRKLRELEADQFSGSVLRMLGATLPEAQAGVETIQLEGESNTHPAKIARREAVANGWKSRDEWLRERGMTTEPVVKLDEPTATVPATQAHPQTTKPVTAFDLERCNDCPPMVFVQGGPFTMGCTAEQGSDCADSESPAHQVTVPDFYIGKYEIPQAEWEAVMGNNPSHFKDCPRCPVESVSWDDVQLFIQKLNEKTGMNFRLPSEAEWEYAARGGQKSKQYKYAGNTNNLGLVAWWHGNSGRKTHPVGERRANELGLYDLSGNVCEWCADGWHGNYIGALTDGTVWESAELDGSRIIRGGAWLNNPLYCRNTFRNVYRPDYRDNFIGFRLALSAQ